MADNRERERERQTDRQRETQRDRERQRQTDRQTETDRDRQRETETERTRTRTRKLHYSRIVALGPFGQPVLAILQTQINTTIPQTNIISTIKQCSYIVATNVQKHQKGVGEMDGGREGERD